MTTSLKELNTTEGKNKFRFQSFRDRVDDLHFDVVHLLERNPIDLEASGSHFKEVLEKWSEQNCTANFKEFLKAARNHSNSLAQLLHSKGKFTALFRFHLNTDCPVSLEPILNLIPPLARDLQDEFYPNFLELYPSIEKLLHHKDAKVIEWSFNAIAYSFKYLAKSIGQKLSKIFKLLSPLLSVSDGRNYLRQFAAESFGFLVRRAKGPKLKQIISEILTNYAKNRSPTLLQGTNSLLLESMKNVGGRLHSQAKPILSEMLAVLLDSKFDLQGDSLEECHPVYELFQLNVTSICSYAGKQHIEPLWAIISEHVGVLSQMCSDQPLNATLTLKITISLGVFNRFMSYNDGICVPSYLPFFELAHHLLPYLVSASQQPLLTKKEVLCFFGLVLSQSPPTEIFSKGKSLISGIFSTKSPDHISDLCLILLGVEFKHFSQLVLPELVELMSKDFQKAPETYLLLLLRILKSNVIEAGSLLSCLSSTGQIQFSSKAPLSWMLGELAGPHDWHVLSNEVELASDKSSFPAFSRISCILYVLIHIKDASEAVGTLEKFLDSLLVYLRVKESSPCFSGVLCEALVGQVITALAKLIPVGVGLTQFWEARILGDILPRFHKSKPILQAIAPLASTLQFRLPGDLFSTDRLKTMFELLKPSLASYDSGIRIACFEILSRFDLGEYCKTSPDESDIFALCLAVDRTPSDIQSHREKLLHLRKLGILAANGSIPHFDAIVPSLCLGMFCVDFRPLWIEASKTLKVHSSRNPKLIGKMLIDTLELLLHDEYTLEYKRIVTVATKLSEFTEEVPETLPQLLNLLFAKDGSNQTALDMSTKHLLSVTQPLETKLDHWNIADWILQTLADSPHLAEAQGTRIVNSFLEVYACYSSLITPDSEGGPKPLVGQPVYKQLLGFLKLLGRFHRPSALAERPQLEAIYEELLINGDSAVQGAALRCIEGYKYPFLVQYSSHLHGFLDEVRFRDELTTFTFDSEVIDKDHRTQLIPYVIRLLYGRLRSKKKYKVSQNLQTALHKAILAYLARLRPEELSLMLDLIFKPFLPLLNQTTSDQGFQLLKEAPLPDPRIQSSFLHLLTHVLGQLGALLEQYLPSILCILIHILQATGSAQGQAGSPLLKEIRQQGLKRLLEVFGLAVHFDFTPFMDGLFTAVIKPRLENLAAENLQSPSALLHLFLSWSKDRTFAPFLVDYDARVLPNLYLCMASPHAKVPVASLVLDLIESIFRLDESDETIDDKESMMNHVLVPSVSHLLDALEIYMANPLSEDATQRNSLFKRQVHILSRIAGFVASGDQAAKLLSLLTGALHKPSKVLDDLTKRDILVIVSELVKRVPGLQELGPLFYKHYQSLARLFFGITHRESRMALLSIFASFSLVDPSLAVIMPAIADLNAFSKRRLDEPDYDRRLAAFSQIHDQLASTLSAHQWLPLLYNFLFFLTDENEMSLRNSGLFALTKFMQAASGNLELQPMMLHVVFPTIKRGLKSRSETIRAEFIQLLGVAVGQFPTMEPFCELVPLLGQSKKVDEEEKADEIEQTNFFVGIYHMQRARRVKVLSRLTHHLNQSSTKCGPPIRASLLQGVFLPICTDLIFNCSANEVTYEVVRAISAISRHLPWSAYYALFRHYYSLLVKKPEKEVLFLKLLFSVLEGFPFDISSSTLRPSEAEGEPKTDVVPLDTEEDDMEIDDGEEKATVDHIHTIMVRHLIPDLLKLLAKCPEDKVPDRIPLALLVARLLKRLPQASFKKQLPSLLMNVCTLLKSRNITTRDTTRSMLVKIAQLIGAPHLFFIIKELQSTLDRGFMRHILGFTVHALMVALAPSIKVGEIDHAGERIMQVITEDMFGDTSQEKEAKEYSGKQKEAMAHKSPFTLELLASVISFKSLGILLTPLKAILQTTDNGQTLKKIDEALIRISAGLVKNGKFESTHLLTFCHGLISQNIVMCQPPKAEGKDQKSITFTVHTRRKRIGEDQDYFAVNAHKFVEFGLGLLLTSLRRDKLGLQGDEIIKHLNPFVDIMGEALYSNYQTVVISAIKIVMWLMRHPLPALNSSLPVMVKRILAIVHKLNATQSELVQTSFKLLTAVIKDARLVTIKNNELQFLLELMRPDLVEPSRQGTTFSLIRAIMARKLMVHTLYDLVDDIGGFMVTSQADSVRATCRQVYVQFFLEYPHGGPRIEAQMKLLVANLSYEFESGRESVMEVMHSLINKMALDIFHSYAEMFFLGLVVVLINDDSNKCREMAGALIKLLIPRLDAKLLGSISQLIFRWCDISISTIDASASNLQLKRTGLQTLGLLISALESGSSKFTDRAIKVIIEAAEQGILLLDEAQARQIQIQQRDPSLDLERLNIPTHWEIPYYALHTFSKLIQVFPQVLSAPSCLTLWPAVTRLLLHPHTWLRTISQRLFGSLFATVDATTLQLPTGNHHPYINIDNLVTITKQLCTVQKSPLFDDDLGQQWVKNMFFIGKAFYSHHLKIGMTSAVVHELGDESSDESDAGKDQDLAHKSPLNWLLKRCSYLGRFEVLKAGVFVRKTYIFQLFAALASQIEPDHLKGFLVPIMFPLFRTLQDPVIKVDPSRFPSLIELATEVDTFIKSRVDPTSYLETITLIQNVTRNRRNARKDSLAQKALSNPQGYAAARAARNQNKHVAKKRRKEELAMIPGGNKKRRGPKAQSTSALIFGNKQ
ncbi:U3 snoRNP protein [Entomophthora muscae]|uniref:U3 snoRNP protein n=1 Tax=Entomophthora muscae TaxID=34485 RepID=A0ACC2SM99_9FUNG|nr:U3 snoRNP protein [Entomophthora muscae]